MKNKELLFSITEKDFELSRFSGTGAGGQHRNKHQNCVRLKHIETGVITTGQDDRSFEVNKKNAFNRMINHPDFKTFLRLKIAKESVDKNQERIDLEKKVDLAMSELNLKVEYFTPEDK